MMEEYYLCWKESIFSMIVQSSGELIKIVKKDEAEKWLQKDNDKFFPLGFCRSIQPLNRFLTGTT